LYAKKGTPDSPATALANVVLPVSGGPISKTPGGYLPPRRVKCCDKDKISIYLFFECQRSFIRPLYQGIPTEGKTESYNKSPLKEKQRGNELTK
jgi:hypothetical protein